MISWMIPLIKARAIVDRRLEFLIANKKGIKQKYAKNE
jgi:hypothetical protein